MNIFKKRKKLSSFFDDNSGSTFWHTLYFQLICYVLIHVRFIRKATERDSVFLYTSRRRGIMQGVCEVAVILSRCQCVPPVFILGCGTCLRQPDFYFSKPAARQRCSISHICSFESEIWVPFHLHLGALCLLFFFPLSAKFVMLEAILPP